MRLLSRLRAIAAAQPITDAQARRSAWESCWLSADGRPFMEADEAAHVRELVRELCGKYFDADDESRGVAGVAEFGCGSGVNLKDMRRRPVHGFDWSQAAVDRLVAEGIPASVFDMFAPSEVNIRNWGVLTVHAMEQLGSRWVAFLGFLLGAGPAVVVHVEPVKDWYGTSLHDLLSRAYHTRRGYLSGYVGLLEQLERNGEIEILELRRATFRGHLHDANSVIVWRPKPWP